MGLTLLVQMIQISATAWSVTMWERTVVPIHPNIPGISANAPWLQETKTRRKEFGRNLELQEGAGGMTVLEAAGNVYCAAVRASTLLAHLQLHRPRLKLIQVQKKCT